MSYEEYKPIIFLSVLLGFLILAVYVVSAYWPRYEEYFFELGLLSSEENAEGYFPNNSSTVFIGDSISWKIYVHNHMGSEQEISIRVKILNSTMQAADDRNNKPSPEPYIMEIPISLSIDETVLVPFSWSLLDVEYQNGSVIKSVIVNGESVDVDVKSVLDGRFRIIFELWVYDQSSDQLVYGWHSKGEFYSASIYMWFNV